MCIQSLQAGQKRCKTKLRPLRVREPLNLINMPHLFIYILYFSKRKGFDQGERRDLKFIGQI